MLLVAALFSSTLVMQPPADSKPAVVPLFAEEKWYKDAAPAAQPFEGVLDWMRGQGRIGLPSRYHTFRLQWLDGEKLIVRPIYANGKDYLLSPYVGHRVRLSAKAVETEIDGKQVTELWPAQLEDLGPAPANALAGIGIIARTETWNWLPSGFAQHSKPEPVVLRDAKEAAKFLGTGTNTQSETRATTAIVQALGKQSIDWAKQMVVIIPGGVVSGFAGARVDIDQIALQDDGLNIYWHVTPQGSRISGVDTHPVTTVLIAKYNDAIHFHQEGK
jgi:hypothetical protein